SVKRRSAPGHVFTPRLCESCIRWQAPIDPASRFYRSIRSVKKQKAGARTPALQAHRAGAPSEVGLGDPRSPPPPTEGSIRIWYKPQMHLDAAHPLLPILTLAA